MKSHRHNFVIGIDDIIPLFTISAYNKALQEEASQYTSIKIENIPIEDIRRDEISMWDKDSKKGNKQEKIYDASSKFEGGPQPQNKTLGTKKQTQNQTKHHKSQRKGNQTPHIMDKWDYLLRVKAEDCIKNKITGVYSAMVKKENDPKN